MIPVPEDPCNISLKETVNTGDPVIDRAIMEKAHKNHIVAYAVWQTDVEQYHHILQMRGLRPSGTPIPPYPAYPPPLSTYVEFAKATYKIPSTFSTAKSTDPDINTNDPDDKCRPGPLRSNFKKITRK
jgi:hypothetical protein